MSKTRQSNRQSQSARKAPVSACLQKPRSVLFHLPEIIFLTARFSANCLKVSWGQYLIDLIRDTQSPDNRPSSCSQDQDAKDRACSVGLPIDLYETIKVQAKQQSLSCGAYVSQLVSLAFSNELQKSVRELCQSIRPTATVTRTSPIPELPDAATEKAEVDTAVPTDEPYKQANHELDEFIAGFDLPSCDSENIPEQLASEVLPMEPPIHSEETKEVLVSLALPKPELEIADSPIKSIRNTDLPHPEQVPNYANDCWPF